MEEQLINSDEYADLFGLDKNKRYVLNKRYSNSFMTPSEWDNLLLNEGFISKPLYTPIEYKSTIKNNKPKINS